MISGEGACVWLAAITTPAARHALTLPFLARAVGDRPGAHDGREHERRDLGYREGCSGRGVIDDDDPQGGFDEKGDTPYGRDDPEDPAVALVLPEPGHLLAPGGVRPGEFPGEAEHQRPPCPQRAQARHAEYGRGHRPLDQHQPGIVTGQANHRAHDDPGQDHGTDHIEAPVLDDANSHAQGGEHPTSPTRSPRSSRSWSKPPRSPTPPLAIRALPSITGSRSTEPASTGPSAPSRHFPLNDLRRSPSAVCTSIRTWLAAHRRPPRRQQPRPDRPVAYPA